jgi:predicted nucleic acid-binding protein
VELVTPGQRHWEIFKNLLAQCGTAGNLVTDAHIAALALERGYAVYSADNDFRRFPGIRHVNPLAQ